MLFQEPVDCRLKQERVVDGNQADAFIAIPAWLTPTRDTRIHDIVRDEEERLELRNLSALDARRTRDTHELDTPPQYGRLEVLLLCQCPSLQDFGSVYHGKTTVELATGHIIVEDLLHK